MQKLHAWNTLWLAQAYRVLKPGGVIKAFSGTRTMHRLAAAMEEVGFVLDPADSPSAWSYGSGFPKSLSVDKAINKHFGKLGDRQVTGIKPGHAGFADAIERYHQQTAPATPEAQRHAGYGTALKPAWEPFIVGRKPA